MQERFRQFAHRVSESMGSPWAFLGALALVAGWAVSGFVFQFSSTWQLFINTFTTIVTFLMVFLIQNTQNRDARVIHLKLDELIRASDKARTELVNLEGLNDEELVRLQKEFEGLQARYGAATHHHVRAIREELHDRRGRSRH